uniref:Ycf36 n=1 Tax=Callithamnion tetricum TaxID=193179 RepID=A0A4D6WM61_9FLOR|nr:hypothetical protein [Callithamnion tetricum]
MCLFNKKCPIPVEQQPLNEYFSLKDSWFFNISTYKWTIYLQYIARIYFVLFLLIFVIILFFNPLININNISRVLCLDALMVETIIICLCIRIYLGWSYVCKRLLSATVFYEESGWYDGQIWIKTSESLIQDRLIGLYEVTPSIEKIQYTLFVSIIFFIIQYFLYSLL